MTQQEVELVTQQTQAALEAFQAAIAGGTPSQPEIDAASNASGAANAAITAGNDEADHIALRDDLPLFDHLHEGELWAANNRLPFVRAEFDGLSQDALADRMTAVAEHGGLALRVLFAHFAAIRINLDDQAELDTTVLTSAHDDLVATLPVRPHVAVVDGLRQAVADLESIKDTLDAASLPTSS